MRRAVGIVLVTLLVVSAGCLGGTGGDLGASDGTDADAGDGATGGDDGDGTDDDGTATDGDSVESVDGPAGTMNFYVSDQPNDMDDFESLNVTVTEVRFHLVDAEDEEEDETETNGTATVTETNETATVTDTATATVANDSTTETATLTAERDDEAAREADGDGETESDEEGEERDDEAETDEEREESKEEDESSDDEAGDGDGRWVTREVNETTVDLTKLRGANATMLEQFGVPAGEYNKVVLEVSETNGTLTNGESTEVHLPSDKLQLKMDFTVANASEVDFVYDVTVKKAGKSGKYVLRPVVSESGTDQEIERVDEKGEKVDEKGEKGEKGEKRGDDGEDERGDDRNESSLSVTFVGQVAAGENATVKVTREGDPVENATVSLDGEQVGTTAADGTLTVLVPSDAEDVEVEVTAGDAEGELERELRGGDDRETDGDDGQTDDGGNGQGADSAQNDGQATATSD